ncbi:MAG: CoA pyrophosphatase [Magnetococcus sp. YQC-9]
MSVTVVTETEIVSCLHEKSGPTYAARFFASATPLVEAAVIMPLIPRETEWDILFIRRNQFVAHHPGQIAFPGGRAEPGDPSPLHTAVREFREELGIQLDPASILGPLPPTPTQQTGFLIHPFAARLDPPFTLITDPAEVEATLLIPLKFFLDAVTLSPHATRFDFHGAIVWGATARVLTDFCVTLLTRTACES